MYYAQRRGLNKRSRDALILVILLLLLALVVTTGLYISLVRRDANAEAMLLGEGENELGQARASMSQISRVGGSFSTQAISQMRQHLYAVARLNEIASKLYGTNYGLVDDAAIYRALDTVSICEARLLQGQGIDEQLQTLRVNLDQIENQLRIRRI
ncbi:MAG: hypothetical protein LBB86_06910 [Oscillospiraceae bacterium]|nr:hypothetical protein [Oscillospiraceae bacterium]